MASILYVATVASHVKEFHLPFIELLRSRGHRVEVACRLDLALDLPTVWDVPFSRSPYSPSNVAAYRALRRLIRERRFDLIHAHTPVAAFLTRLAARDLNIPVLYTAHGFHFYRGAPPRNWLLYYNLERLAAPWTAGLVVMNGEDLEAGRRLGFVEGENLFRTHGVGVDLAYSGGREAGVRAGHGSAEVAGLAPDAPAVLCVAEFTPNKNHPYLLDAWARVVREMPEARLLLAGAGETLEKVKAAARRRGLNGSVLFLGYRTDIPELLARCDALVLVSRREGLSRAILEAMAAGRPVVAANVRGCRELVTHGETGLLVPLGRPEVLAGSLLTLLRDAPARSRMGEAARRAARAYSLEVVLGEMAAVLARYGCG